MGLKCKRNEGKLLQVHQDVLEALLMQSGWTISVCIEYVEIIEQEFFFFSSTLAGLEIIDGHRPLSMHVNHITEIQCP